MGKLVSATKFKAKSLKLIDEIERSGETITHRGKPSPILTARKLDTSAPKSLFGLLKGSVTILGDIVGPVDPDWEAKWGGKWDEKLGASSAKPSSLDAPRVDLTRTPHG